LNALSSSSKVLAFSPRESCEIFPSLAISYKWIGGLASTLATDGVTDLVAFFASAALLTTGAAVLISAGLAGAGVGFAGAVAGFGASAGFGAAGFGATGFGASAGLGAAGAEDLASATF
jgi:hypothetical protein